MALPASRLRLAVRVAERALRASPGASLDDRLDAFRIALSAIEGLDAGDEAWTEETMEVAWSLAEDQWPSGGDPAEVVASLVAAHAAVCDASQAPRPRQPSRPRRDG